MSYVEITNNPTYVEVSETNNQVSINQTSTVVELAGPVTINNAGGLKSRERVLGSSFSGSDGATGRSYTYSSSLGTLQLVAVGTSTGVLTILDSSGGYSLSTTTNTNDTLTITGELFNDDAVIVWQ